MCSEAWKLELYDIAGLIQQKIRNQGDQFLKIPKLQYQTQKHGMKDKIHLTRLLIILIKKQKNGYRWDPT